MKKLLEKFRKLPDYRIKPNEKFNVGETLFLSLLAKLANADGYDDASKWMKSKKRELSKFLGRPFSYLFRTS
jgi:hypothetical protein